MPYVSALLLFATLVLGSSSDSVPAVCEPVSAPAFQAGTLEDLYGDSGPTFRGAIGFLVAEGTSDEQPETGFGVSVDDMVFMWKEVALDPDVTECAAGSCAVVTLPSTNYYLGNSVLPVTVLDPTPYGADGVNDCNGDGDYVDAGIDDTDCDDNGIPDVIAEATSDNAADRERMVLNRTGGHRYAAELPISTAIDVEGTLFLMRNGSDLPTVLVSYQDLDDGTGQPCDNSVDPAAVGLIRVSTTVFVPSIDVVVKGFRLEDHGASGDGDGIADPNEEVQAFLTLANQSDVDLSNVVARLQTDDPTIDCVLTPVVTVGEIPARGMVEASNPFVFHVEPSVERSSLDEEITATFRVTLTGNEFDALLEAQSLAIDLDLDLAGGSGPTTFSEGFESGYGAFGMIDDNDQLPTNELSDGLRCQYSDPDFVNSNTYGETACFLGGLFPIFNDSYWVMDNPTTRGAAARAYTGTGSLHWGDFTPGDPTGGDDTMGFGQLENIATTSPIHLDSPSAGGATPRLTFKHQIQIAGYRHNTPLGNAAVQVQETDGTTGNEIGPWRKLTPYQNRYDSQPSTQFAACYFDPTDDGHDEDDFFDPNDPDRRYGPSSLCYPNFLYVRQGSTNPLTAFDPNALGAAAGPGLRGQTGGGTWVETAFDLSRYHGRSVRLRFLVATVEVDGITATFEDLYRENPTQIDDGWWIDDVQVEGALVTPNSVTVDTRTVTEPSPCDDAPCTTVSASLEPFPSTAPAPGHAVELSALGAIADRCVSGTLQFRFYEDLDDNGSYFPEIDTLLQGWSDNAVAVVAATAGTRYTVDVRCSSFPACTDSASLNDLVACPGSVSPLGPFEGTIHFSSATRLVWPTPQRVDIASGSLDSLRLSGGFADTVESLDRDPFVPRQQYDIFEIPLPGAGRYYLVRRNACNADPTWGNPMRDLDLP